MSENLKGLLEKINQEGVKSAEEKAKAIEAKARKDAEKIIDDAKKLAASLVQEANLANDKARSRGEASLKQASRDLLLSLKDEIKKIFNKIMALEINKAMTPEETAMIIASLIEKYVDKSGQASDISILLNKVDLEKIKSDFMGRLKDKIKSGVEFKPSPNITAGFSISFDRGKSYFDFSEEGLLDTLSAYLNPELAKIIK